MNFINKMQFHTIWFLGLICAVLMGMFYPEYSEENFGSWKNSNNSVNDLHRDTKDLEQKGNILFQLLSGTNTNLGGDGINVSGATSTVSNAVPFSAVGGNNRNVPFIAAIVIENGEARVFIREGDEETQILSVGDEWDGWTIEVIDATRVYFSSAEEEFDYFVFATLGQE